VPKKISKELSNKLKLLPTEPGVYLFKDRKGKIIYVGKAAVLRNRVRSYFQSGLPNHPKTFQLESEITDVEYIVSASVREALILEDTLVKRHQPRFNIRLRDDKRYPYLKISNEPFPRISVVRRIGKDVHRGARYFGPYTNAKAMRQTKKLLQQLFHIRTCSLDIRDKPVRARPCLDHYIGLCDAPCVGWISQDAYRELIEDAELFLHGHYEELLPKLRKSMKQASSDMQFEQAARLRDQIDSLERLYNARRTMDPKGEDRDAIGIALENDRCAVQVFFIRSGKLVGRESFSLTTAGSEDPKEILSAFIKQFYSKGVSLPKEILLPNEIEEQELVEEWLQELAGRKLTLKIPQRGEKAKWIRMATRNAELSLSSEKTREEIESSRVELINNEIEEIFNWEGPFSRIEGYDISNIQGSDPVASMVVFEDAAPKKSNYRKFKIQTSGPDDFAMIAEVIRRRLERALAGDPKFLPFPDLILIDGGKGQLSSARNVMWDLGLEKIPTLGLAKEYEQLFTEGQSKPYILPKDYHMLKLLQHIRDESHRFALSFHRQRRDKRTLQSVLDEIPGVGKARKRALIDHFGSMKQLKSASLEELLEVPKLPQITAQAIYEALHK